MKTSFSLRASSASLRDRRFARRARGAVTALAANRDGATAAEFALMLPLMCTMLIGTMQVGLMMYAYNDMTSVARDVTRQMAVCTIHDLPTATSTALANLTSEAPWVPASKWTISPAGGGSGADVQMTIQVAPTYAGIIAWLPFPVSQLTTHVQMAPEPLAYGGGTCPFTS